MPDLPKRTLGRTGREVDWFGAADQLGGGDATPYQPPVSLRGRWRKARTARRIHELLVYAQRRALRGQTDQAARKVICQDFAGLLCQANYAMERGLW